MTQPSPQALAAAEELIKCDVPADPALIAAVIDRECNLPGLLKAAEQAYKHMKENGDAYTRIRCRASQDFWAIVCQLEVALKLTLNGKAGIGLL